MQRRSFAAVKIFRIRYPSSLISTAAGSDAHHACTMSNITFGNVYVAALYFSCRKDVSRGKMWKVRGTLRTRGPSGRLPGDSFCPRRPSRQLRLREQNLKEPASHYKFSASHQTSAGAAETTAFY